MKRIFNKFQMGLALLLIILTACQNQKKNKTADEEFPSKMVDFEPHKSNSVFSGTNNGTWDNQIRERGYILFEDGIYKMWYSGYNGGDTIPKYLGYATSDDGINWKRYSVLNLQGFGNPEGLDFQSKSVYRCTTNFPVKISPLYKARTI